MKHVVITTMLIFAVSTHSYALDARIDGKTAVIDDGLGVEFRVASDGRLDSIRSTYTHPVDFPDRRGVNKAYIIAEEKAKAAIARFIQQTVTSARAISEIDRGLETASQKRGTEGQTWSKDNSRKVEEALTELTGSSATAILRGVKVVSRSYDDMAAEVTVVVGINSDSEAVARQLPSGIDRSRNPDDGQSSSSFPGIPSERRQSHDGGKY